MGATLFGMRLFINFLLIDATDRSKISSDQKRFFIALSLHPLSFFANTPFNLLNGFRAIQHNVSNDVKMYGLTKKELLL